MLRKLGFEALATTSSGFAFSIGKPDGEGAVEREETLGEKGNDATGRIGGTDKPCETGCHVYNNKNSDGERGFVSPHKSIGIS